MKMKKQQILKQFLTFPKKFHAASHAFWAITTTWKQWCLEFLPSFYGSLFPSHTSRNPSLVFKVLYSPEAESKCKSLANLLMPCCEIDHNALTSIGNLADFYSQVHLEKSKHCVIWQGKYRESHSTRLEKCAHIQLFFAPSMEGEATYDWGCSHARERILRVNRVKGGKGSMANMGL